MSEKDATWVQRSYLKTSMVKVRSQKFTRRQKSETCRATQVFLVILHVEIDSDDHLTLWRHQCLLLTEVRSRSDFEVNIFFHKSTNFWLTISSWYQIFNSSLRCVELQISQVKNDATLFPLYFPLKTPKTDIFLKISCAHSTCSSLTYCTFC